jgi:uncharacterized Fe-S cluster protein YjdI
MAMSDNVRHYADDRIDISYDARRCIHAAECLRGLPAVFDTARRPWILPSGASADAIAAVIAKCPSGALHFTRRDGGQAETPPEHTTIVPMPRGPLHVHGRVELRSADGGLMRCAAVGSHTTSRSATTAIAIPDLTIRAKPCAAGDSQFCGVPPLRVTLYSRMRASWQDDPEGAL